MKYGKYLVVVAVLGAGGLWYFQNKTYISHTTHVSQEPPPSITINDPATVFQKALWKRPTAADKILHAERREWKDADADAVSRWQWFLEVEPSPAIVRYLREENAFRLKSCQTITLPADVPPWFIRDTKNARILSEPGGGMQLIFTAGDAKLYAMGRGGGFHPGAPEKPPGLAQAPAAAGRIPLEAPPSHPKP